MNSVTLNPTVTRSLEEAAKKPCTCTVTTCDSCNSMDILLGKVSALDMKKTYKCYFCGCADNLDQILCEVTLSEDIEEKEGKQ